MNLQQLQYILAIHEAGSFSEAAEACFVTQSTLSIMVKKLEEELKIQIFDRSHQPIQPTDLGLKIITQASLILREANNLRMLVDEETGGMTGSHSMAIIPTLAPYLLPLFIDNFLKKYPGITLQVFEWTTEVIIQKLRNRELDIGILAVPISHHDLKEFPLFREEFVVYAPGTHPYKEKKYILPADIDPNKLWLLEEGHCLRNQVINLCELKDKERKNHPLDFSAGSIETLKRLVASNHGITILPYLAIDFLSEKEVGNLYFFEQPAPEREIGLITHQYFSKHTLLEALKQEILCHLPPSVSPKV